MEEKLTVSQFVEIVNQALGYSFSSVLIEGEVSGFKVNQGKWVFFDLKDEECSVSCFLPLFQLRMALEDGMKIIIKGEPKVTKWGKFSVTVRQMKPVGEGDIKKNFELLKKKLTAEGLFDSAKKRSIPDDLKRIGVISSTQAAGYADFCKILNARWGGLEVLTAHCQVQGIDAPDQMIRALEYFNERADVDIIAIMRGGGSADDLSAFNDEELVRRIAASRIPVITGIGHEIDESLADLAADIRASTPSNVAEMLTLDKMAEMAKVRTQVSGVKNKILRELNVAKDAIQLRGIRTKVLQEIENMRGLIQITGARNRMSQELNSLIGMAGKKVAEVRNVLRVKTESLQREVEGKIKMVEAANPLMALKRGYAIISGEIAKGKEIKIRLEKKKITAEIKKVKEEYGG